MSFCNLVRYGSKGTVPEKCTVHPSVRGTKHQSQTLILMYGNKRFHWDFRPIVTNPAPCWGIGCRPYTVFAAVLRIQDVYPGSWFLPIPDPGSKKGIKREGWKKICCYTFSCRHKFHKNEHYLIFEMLKKNIWANFQSSLTYGFGIRIQGSKRHRIPDPDPQHWFAGQVINSENQRANSFIPTLWSTPSVSCTCRQCVAPLGPCATCRAGPRAGRWPPAPPRRGRPPAHPANRGRSAAPAHRCAACRGSTRPPGPLHIQDLINTIKRQDNFSCS